MTTVLDITQAVRRAISKSSQWNLRILALTPEGKRVPPDEAGVDAIELILE